MTTPKPCPFCGGGTVYTTSDEPMSFWVMCDDCLAGGPHELTEHDAIAAWNKMMGEVERLREACAEHNRQWVQAAEQNESLRADLDFANGQLAMMDERARLALNPKEKP